MSEQMYAPKAVLLVQEHVNELIDCYGGLRSAGWPPHKAIMDSFNAVLRGRAGR